MRTVIIGFGRIANSIRYDRKMATRFKYASHAQVLTEHPDFKWLGVVEPDHSKWGEAHLAGAPYCSDSFEWFRERDDAECAVLAVPPEARMDVLRALPNLRAVMVEKPLGPQREAFLTECTARDIRVQVNFWRRGVPLFRNTHIAAPQAVFATYGNGLYNNGSHLLDFLQMKLGRIVSARAVSAPVRLEVLGCGGPQDDYHVAAHLLMEHSSGTQFPVFIAPLNFDRYREVGVDIWCEYGRHTYYQESLTWAYHAWAPHRAMEGQYEVQSDRAVQQDVDVNEALYNLYTNLASEEPLWSPGWRAAAVEDWLDVIAKG